MKNEGIAFLATTKFHFKVFDFDSSKQKSCLIDLNST